MRSSPLRLAAALLPVLLAGVLAPDGARADTTTAVLTLGDRTPWRTLAYVREATLEGPTVMIVGGQHGNEPAGVLAAEQIRRWPLRRGRLVVVPRANLRALLAGQRVTPGVAEDVANLNRNYPRHANDPPRGEVARAIWALAKTYRPDWLLDLHEGRVPHRLDQTHYANCVIHHPDQADAKVVAERMIEAVDRTIAVRARRYVRLVQVTKSTLARSAADRLGARALTLETCYTQGPLSRRVRRHRIMVLALLSRLGMLDPVSVGVDTLLPTARAEGEIRVAVYDAEGTCGPGVSRAWTQLRLERGTTVMRVGPEDVRGGALETFDVVTFTGGNGPRQAKALGEEGRRAVVGFVKGGGGYVGVGAGARLALGGCSWSLGILDGTISAGRYGKGRVVVIGPPAEPTRGLEHVLPRAARWAAGRGPSPR